MFVVDPIGRSSGWLLLHGPIQSESRKDLFAAHRDAELRLIGMTSYLTWPSTLRDDPLDYGAVCEGWCHCFKDPDLYLPPGGARRLISFSDFVDPWYVDPSAIQPRHSALPPFDFVYVAANDPVKNAAKGWDLAVGCIAALCRSGFNGLVIGAPDGTVPWTARLTMWPRVPYWTFLTVLNSCRFLFVPSANDPSPRILAEALCLDVPIMVNRQVLGGWKYVNDMTGAFFDTEHDVVAGVTDLLERPTAPRRWWCATHGPGNAGRRLRDLIAELDPENRYDAPLLPSYSINPS